jgi:hypothetical protein
MASISDRHAAAMAALKVPDGGSTLSQEEAVADEEQLDSSRHRALR